MSTFWNNGGNWLALFVCFCLIEAPGLFWGQYTLTRTLRHWFGAYGAVVVLAFTALAMYLYWHFFIAGR